MHNVFVSSSISARVGPRRVIGAYKGIMDLWPRSNETVTLGIPPADHLWVLCPSFTRPFHHHWSVHGPGSHPVLPPNTSSLLTRQSCSYNVPSGSSGFCLFDYNEGFISKIYFINLGGFPLDSLEIYISILSLL